MGRTRTTSVCSFSEFWEVYRQRLPQRPDLLILQMVADNTRDIDTAEMMTITGPLQQFLGTDRMISDRCFEVVRDHARKSLDPEDSRYVIADEKLLPLLGGRTRVRLTKLKRYCRPHVTPREKKKEAGRTRHTPRLQWSHVQFTSQNFFAVQEYHHARESGDLFDRDQPCRQQLPGTSS